MMKFIRPQTKKVDSYIVEVNGIQIRVNTNTEDVLYRVVPRKNYYYVEYEIHGMEIPSINLIKSSSLKSDYVVRKEDNSSKLSTQSCGIEYPNEIYLFNNQNILLNQYPNNSIIISDISVCNYIIVAADISILIFYLKMYLKKIVIQKINKCTLHASAIGNNEGGFAFLGNGNSGKSTLAYNLSQCGWRIINDDLVFVDTKNDEFLIRGVDINPCMRRKALPYVLDIDAFYKQTNKMYENVYHECFYLQMDNVLSSPVALKCLFALSFDSNTTMLPYLITETDIKIKVLEKSNRSIGNEANLLSLASLPMYNLNINCPVDKISDFLRTI